MKYTSHLNVLPLKLLPVCAAGCMVGINPPGGRIPLRLRLGPSIGFEPLISVWELLHKQHRSVMETGSQRWVTTCESLYQTELTTLMKLSPVGFAMTCEEVVPVVMDVPMVGRGIVMTGKVWLRASCCCAKGVRRAGCGWLCTKEGSDGVGVNERGAQSESAGCGVEHGVFVGVGVDGLGVPDPKGTKQTEYFKWRKEFSFRVEFIK